MKIQGTQNSKKKNLIKAKRKKVDTHHLTLNPTTKLE